MNTKVDVLAVMDADAAHAYCFLWNSEFHHADDCASRRVLSAEARSAVAELVAVAREIPCELRDRNPIKARLIAALAKFGDA